MQLLLLSSLSSNYANTQELRQLHKLPHHLAAVMRAGTMLNTSSKSDDRFKAAENAVQVALGLVTQVHSFGRWKSTFGRPARRLAHAGIFAAAMCIVQHGNYEVRALTALVHTCHAHMLGNLVETRL